MYLWLVLLGNRRDKDLPLCSSASLDTDLTSSWWNKTDISCFVLNLTESVIVYLDKRRAISTDAFKWKCWENATDEIDFKSVDSNCNRLLWVKWNLRYSRPESSYLRFVDVSSSKRTSDEIFQFFRSRFSFVLLALLFSFFSGWKEPHGDQQIMQQCGIIHNAKQALGNLESKDPWINKPQTSKNMQANGGQ